MRKEKLTLADLEENKSWEKAIVVFTEDSFNRYFTEIERSYEVWRDNNYFNPNAISNSLFGSCLDGNDDGVRLDLYMGGWKIEHCYITK